MSYGSDGWKNDKEKQVPENFAFQQLNHSVRVRVRVKPEPNIAKYTYFKLKPVVYNVEGQWPALAKQS